MTISQLCNGSFLFERKIVYKSSLLHRQNPTYVRKWKYDLVGLDSPEDTYLPKSWSKRKFEHYFHRWSLIFDFISPISNTRFWGAFHSDCARSCEPGSQCRPNECIFF
jgi:hypothetical protein